MPSSRTPARFRRPVLLCALAPVLFAALVLTNATAAHAASATITVHSRHDLHPPRTTVKDYAGVTPGSIFLTPRALPGQLSGPMIIGSDGTLQWYHQMPKGQTAIDLEPQRLNGQRVATYIQRPAITGANIYSGNTGNTFAVIMDQHYKTLAKVHAVGKGVVTDLHDFVIGKDGTRALLLGFRIVRANLSSVGGPSNGTVVENLVQIVDIKTNKLVYDWHGLTHIPLTESMAKPPPEGPFDYTHFNSVNWDRDGNILVSSRHTSTVMKISRRTGRIIWRVGGKRSNYKIAKGVNFFYQHDFEPTGNGEYTIFDNHSSDFDVKGKEARVIQIRLSKKTKTATLVRQWRHDGKGLQAVSQGDGQRLANGGLFIGWGNARWFTEYSPSGQKVLDGTLPSQQYQSYRAFKASWNAQPGGGPALAASTKSGTTVAWASWDGATTVAKWELLTGSSKTDLSPVKTVAKGGFETRIEVSGAATWAKLYALDANGKFLGRSRPYKVKKG